MKIAALTSLLLLALLALTAQRCNGGPPLPESLVHIHVPALGSCAYHTELFLAYREDVTHTNRPAPYLYGSEGDCWEVEFKGLKPRHTRARCRNVTLPSQVGPWTEALILTEGQSVETLCQQEIHEFLDIQLIVCDEDLNCELET